MVNINLNFQSYEFVANVAALIAPNITDNQSNLTVNSEDWKIPAHLRLADPQYFRPLKIHLQTRFSLFFDLLCVGQKKKISRWPLDM